MFGLMVVLFVMRFRVLLLLARLHAYNWRYWRCGHFDDLGLTPDDLSSSCVGLSSLLGPFADCPEG